MSRHPTHILRPLCLALLLPAAAAHSQTPDPGGWHPGTSPIRFLAQTDGPPPNPSLAPPILRIPTALPDHTYRIFENDKHLGLIQLDAQPDAPNAPPAQLIFLLPPPPPDQPPSPTRLFHLYPLREPVGTQLIATPTRLAHGQISLTPTGIDAPTTDGTQNLPILFTNLPNFSHPTAGPTLASIQFPGGSALILAGQPMLEITLNPNTPFTATLPPQNTLHLPAADETQLLPPPLTAIALTLPDGRTATLSVNTGQLTLQDRTLTITPTQTTHLRLDLYSPTTPLTPQQLLSQLQQPPLTTITTFPPQLRPEGIALRPPCPDCVAALDDALPPALRQRRRNSLAPKP